MRKRSQPAKKMSENRMRVMSLALDQALSAGAVASLATTAVHAQPAEKVEKIEITGSRVKRAYAEGALPVKIFIPWLFEEKFFGAKFNYTDGLFKDYSVIFH